MAHFDWSVAAVSLCVAIVAILLATKMYLKENELPAKMKSALPHLWDWCAHRFYWEELYYFITHKIIFNGISRPFAWFDRHVIDGAINGLGWITLRTSEAVKGFQSGSVQWYAWVFLFATLLITFLTIIFTH